MVRGHTVQYNAVLMGRNDGLISFAEAAARLDVTHAHLGHMVRQGYLRPAKIGRNKHHHLFRQEDVNAVLTMRRRGVDLPKLAVATMQAHSLSLSNAAKLEKICAFLGLENNRLRTDEDSIFTLHLKTVETLKTDLYRTTPAAVLEWASTFNAIDEGYLQLLETFTNDPHPWCAYLDLANAMMTRQNPGPATNLDFAYGCLDAARRHLRHVSYFFVMVRSGERVANKAFIKAELDDEIIAQLHPDMTLVN